MNWGEFFSRRLFPLVLLVAVASTSCTLTGRSSLDLGENGRVPIDIGEVCETLRLDVSGFRNSQGVARAALFRSPEGFPRDPGRASVRAFSEIADGKARIVLRNVPCGVYAIAVIHDEDNDGLMATSTVGIPLEGYCVSNNVKSMFGPPKFEQARFVLHSSAQDMRLRLVYLSP